MMNLLNNIRTILTLTICCFITALSSSWSSNELITEDSSQSVRLTNIRASELVNDNEVSLITRPFLFELEHDHKKSYLLGSNHSITIDRFPDYARKVLLSSKFLILEIIKCFQDHSREQLIECGALRDKSSDYWIDQLDDHLRDYLEEKLTSVIRRYHPDIEVGDLTLLMAFIKYDAPFNEEMDYQLKKNI